MNSKVRYRDEAVDTSRDVKLVYPEHADGWARISVLSPLGAALLGLSVGQEVEARFPGLGIRRLRVQAIISQPEREARKLSIDEKLDEALKHTFPASDPFSLSLGF
jgi:regulator of nucleoside diphosphate kinase